jgi:lipopolysaccharide biosynthesis regulator YciM
VTLPVSVRSLLSLGLSLKSFFKVGTGRRAEADDSSTVELLRRAQEARRLGRNDEAATLLRQVLQTRRDHLAALRGLRDLALETARWREALDAQQRILGAVGSTERSPETEWLAVIYYELGRAEAARSNAAGALAHFKSAARSDRLFLPAALALGDAYELAGDHREAVRTWERAAESLPALPLLARLERAYRQEGRPSRMIALYRSAIDRAPDDLALAVALGRVFLELEMLDEAADQFEKVEVRAPGSAAVHALLGIVFERRGETREAFEEYRRALQLGHAFDWPYRCEACSTAAPMWQDRCAQCHRWNSLRPVGA